MLDKIVSKFSLYDILSMVIPGVTILFFFSRLFSCVWKIKPDFYPNEVAAYFIILVLAYLIGLLNHALTRILWKSFRNTPYLLYDALENATKHSGYSPLKALIERKTKPKGCFSDMVFYCALIYIIVLVSFFCITNIMYCSFKDSDDGVIFIFISTIIYILICRIAMYAINKSFGSNDPKESNDSKDSKDSIVSDYYDAYYFVVKHRYCDDIFIMEGQVAFMQNMILPLSLFAFWPDNIWATFGIHYEVRCFCVKFLLLLLCIALCICVYYRLKKIHELVWENYEYLKINERRSIDAI